MAECYVAEKTRDGDYNSRMSAPNWISPRFTPYANWDASSHALKSVKWAPFDLDSTGSTNQFYY